MFRWRSRAPDAILRLAALALACLGQPVRAAPPAEPPASAPASAPAGASEELVLLASVNGVAFDDPVVVSRVGPALWMSAHDLAAIGIKVPGHAARAALAAIPGLRYRIDTQRQTIDFESTTGPHQSLPMGGGRPPDSRAITPAGWGAIVNYDANISQVGRRRGGGALLDTSLYSPAGYAFGRALVQAGRDRAGSRVKRLESGVVIANPDRMRRIVAGDFITASTNINRPIRMGGVQIGTDFSLRPDLVTFPIPSIGGTAAVPSAVDLVVNGNRQAAGRVKPGQFSITDVPVRVGTNSIVVAVRDSLGRQTVQTISTYTSRALLRPGLGAYSVELGAVRTGFGSVRDRYEGFAASGSYRRGITERLTLESHAEHGAGVSQAGLGSAVVVGGLGQFDLSAAASRARGTGYQLTAGFERLGGPVSLSAHYTVATSRWRDVASRYGAPLRSSTGILNIGFDLGRLGSANVAAIMLGKARLTDPRGPLRDDTFPTARGTTLRGDTLLSASYSVRLDGHASLIATANTSPGRRRSTFASVGLLVGFGPRTSGYSAITSRGGRGSGSGEVSMRAIQPGQFGYRAALSAGEIDRQSAAVEYQSTAGRYDAVVERTDGRTAMRASARGTLLLSPEGAFASDSSTGSMAIVKTGLAGVRIYRDNRFIGTTNRRGKLVVANLNPFETTKLSVDPLSLDEQLAIDAPDLEIRPAERVGVNASFKIYSSVAYAARLVDENGAVLPAGSPVALGDRGTTLVGIDGMLYVTGTGDRLSVAVTLPGGNRCSALLGGPARRQLVTDLGDVVCRRLVYAAR